jgi:hypothetical protein
VTHGIDTMTNIPYEETLTIEDKFATRMRHEYKYGYKSRVLYICPEPSRKKEKRNNKLLWDARALLA